MEKAFHKISSNKDLVNYLDNPFNAPKRLRRVYHYTTLNTLIEICKNGTLNFSPLELMNDRLESEFFGEHCTKKFACFMYSQKESFAMWSMYGGGLKKNATLSPEEIGVKIELPIKNLKRIADHNGITARLVAYTNFLNLTKEKSKEHKHPIYWCGRVRTTKNDEITLDKKMLAGYIKDSAWNYESELRLCIEDSDKTAKTLKPMGESFFEGMKVYPSPLVSKTDCEDLFNNLTKNLNLIAKPKFEENEYAGVLKLL